MKTIYKYIHFVKREDKKRTSVWECRSNRTRKGIGIIRWCASWRQYCYYPFKETILNGGCMKDIIRFMERAEEERKDGKSQDIKVGLED